MQYSQKTEHNAVLEIYYTKTKFIIIIDCYSAGFLLIERYFEGI